MSRSSESPPITEQDFPEVVAAWFFSTAELELVECWLEEFKLLSGSAH